MKNLLSLGLVLSLGIFLVLGCGFGSFGGRSSESDKTGSSDPASGKDKSLTDKAIEEVADGESTGVPECDDLFKFFREQSESKDDNWVTKGIKDFAIGQIKKQIKEDLEKNKGDKAKMAQNCKDAKQKFENRLKEEQDKK